LEPFPTEFKVLDVKQQGDDKAFADLGESADGRPLRLDAFNEPWNVDFDMFRALVPIPWNNRVELRRESQEKGWQIYFPVNQRLRASVDKLKDHQGNYVRALEQVKNEVKHDAATKSDVERR